VSSGNLSIGGDVTVNSNGRLLLSGSSSFGGSLSNNGIIDLSGSITVNRDLTNNGTIRTSNANQCNSISVTGTFRNDGTITSNNLDYGGSGSALRVNKMPEGNASPKLTGGAVVGSCSSVNCRETVTTKESGRTDIIYIFRCSELFSLPETVDDQEVSGIMLLLVAGGGGGGRGEAAGGGGAGAVYESNNIDIVPNIPYQVIVGSGGIGATSIDIRGSDGFPSSFFGIETKGGGGGGSSSATATVRNGRPGGSGGGGAASTDGAGPGGNFSPHSATIGGNAIRNSQNVIAGGGGGGASSKGGNANPPEGGLGGNGMTSSVLAGLRNLSFNNTFSGGGGGTGRNSSSTPVSPALGGSVDGIIIGGSGNNNANGFGGIAVKNTGSGGGAGVAGGGAGATGLVVLRVSFGALPVDYIYFNAVYLHPDRSVKINWATSKEWENSHFEIERSVNNINSWVKVGEVAGMGWTDETTQYVYEDRQTPVNGGSIYYRLRQVDYNLNYEYSQTVMVKVPAMGSSSQWKAFPNPVQDGDHIVLSRQLDSELEGGVEVSLISSQTRILRFSATNGADLNEKLSKAVFQLPKGLFVIELNWEDKIEYLKVLKR